jgi:hypothetical protein
VEKLAAYIVEADEAVELRLWRGKYDGEVGLDGPAPPEDYVV